MKHNFDLASFHPNNRKLLVEKPDRNFSVERNVRVIEAVLAENDKMQRELHEKVKGNAANIADILASFAKYKLDMGGEKQLDQWMGKGWQARVYGEKIVEKIRWAEIMYKQKVQENLKNGNTIMGGQFYLK